MNAEEASRLFYNDEAQRSYLRLLQRLEARFGSFIESYPYEWQAFCRRLGVHFERLFVLLLHLYGGRYDFFYHLEELLVSLLLAWIERPEELKQQDKTREANPGWFLSNEMLGGVCYVDLYAGDIRGVREKIPYFQSLGLTYLHLMPLFQAPAGENDGGYAISSYRDVNPSLGSMQDLKDLARALRAAGISLVLDFVFNHTSDEHAWALAAKAGDPEYREYYRMFTDRQMPDAYERTLREIFPEEHPGAFTYFPDLERWVWTTFHSYQWDLNYANPAVFCAMVSELLALTNIGVDVLRLDAVAFLWKQMGTSCENLPEAHMLIQAFQAAAAIAAPGLLFKSEAIVHPDEVARYIHPDECQLSYNPLLMALLWESLATREVRLLSASMKERFGVPDGCAWVNYVRCHDDIGWTFSDEDAGWLGINGYDHRRFLNAFYTGRFEGSFARGLPFQENPRTGDCRISGTCASLAGLEKAHIEDDEAETDLAVRRILLIHAVILTIGGIPLIYLGDEIATLNDYTYRSDETKENDSRWVHRPRRDERRESRRMDGATPEGRVFSGILRLIKLRKNEPVFYGVHSQIVDSGNPHVFAYARTHAGCRALVLANFHESRQTISENVLRLYGLGYNYRDLLTGNDLLPGDLVLDGYQFICLTAG